MFWSPDGKEIGFFTANKLKKVSLAGGAVSALCDGKDSHGVQTIIDSTNFDVVETVPLGKRLRGIHTSPGRTIYAALTASWAFGAHRFGER